MTNYRRIFLSGGTYCFTAVTYNRLPILDSPKSRSILHSAWMDVNKRFPFTTIAVCLMPDHLHCIWTLPEGDSNYSVRWKEIKRLYTKGFLQKIGTDQKVNESRQKRKEAPVWQRRFWEHAIRNEDDLKCHVEYIHYNPVKHGIVENVADWPWSSFHRYVNEGLYDSQWGQGLDLFIESMSIGE
jgi:putative transposase